MKINVNKFRTYANGHCKASKESPDQKTIDAVIACSKKKPLKGNAVIIVRYQWLKRRKLMIPNDMELPNLCVMIKNGVECRAFYSNVMTHIIKKTKLSYLNFKLIYC